MSVCNLLFLVVSVQVDSQNDYRIIHERISLDWYNTSWFAKFTIVLFHYTRTEKRVNASAHLLRDILGHDLINTIQGYKYQSNEYRLFPLNYSGNACDIQRSRTFGTDLVKFGTNFTLCPTKKGYYYLSNMFVDEKQFPPYAPRGRYMLEFKVYYNKTILLTSGKWYGAIEATDPLERVVIG